MVQSSIGSEERPPNDGFPCHVFGDNVEIDAMQKELLDMMGRGLVMASEVNPSAWQLTEKGLGEARKRKRP